MTGNLLARVLSGRSGFQVSRSLQFVNTQRPWREAILVSVGLSLLFILIYGGCNTLASRQAHPGTAFFAWELRLPFVPALIVPYMSIDLFFFTAPLLCANGAELRALVRQIVTAILVAGLGFILFPLTTAYPRPEVSGWTGWLFEFLWSFDKPHNLVPSLHIALASLLWPVYLRHTGGWLRRFIYLWFTLIVVSALFTWQHHLLDVVTGALLGQTCLFAFPVVRESAPVKSASTNLRIAGLYGAGSLLFGVLAIVFGSWGSWLLWPALSLALIAFAYGRGSSAIFRKNNGRLPVSTRVVLAPYLFGTLMRLWIYNDGRPPWVEVAPGVYCGRLLTRAEADALPALGITAVLDLTAEHAETKSLLAMDYLNVPILDLTSPSKEQLETAVAFIDRQIHRGAVYIHCALGISRSAAVITAYKASRQKDLQQIC
jgi:membrane-associated phospholipid phosphatase